jgi:hypothetical protein
VLGIREYAAEFAGTALLLLVGLSALCADFSVRRRSNSRDTRSGCGGCPGGLGEDRVVVAIARTQEELLLQLRPTPFLEDLSTGVRTRPGPKG